MRLRTLRSGMALKGKRILVRIDANVPLDHGHVVDGPHGKIARAAVDLEWLRQQGARLIVLSHLGRPQGKRVPAYSIRPVAERLSELLGDKVQVVSDIVGAKAYKAVARLKNGQILLLENVRFHPGEKNNDVTFAQSLADLADIYVNDAFAVSHRKHASLSAITKFLPSYAGQLVVKEVSVLTKAIKNPKKPFVLILGGLKMRTKLPVLERLLPKLDSVIIGGALATVFFVAQGKKVGQSVYEKEAVDVAKNLLKKWGKKIFLPSEVMVVKSLRKNAVSRLCSVDKIDSKEFIVDIGPSFVDTTSEVLSSAKTIIWNGPLGYCEIKRFSAGSIAVAKVISERTGKAVTIVGGGDTVPIAEAAGVADRFTLLSTGGGAMLAYLAGEKLPGLSPLKSGN